MSLLQIEDVEALKAEITQLVHDRDAIVLAHNYMNKDLQDLVVSLGDRGFVGDSLQLAREGAKTDKNLIAFCGVEFMAATCAAMNPDKRVLLPDHDAGCSLADSLTFEQLAQWRSEFNDPFVISYVNTDIEVKTISDSCITSSNAVAVTRHFMEEFPEKDFLIGPDMFLGKFVKDELEKELGKSLDGKLHIWQGECHVHAGIKAEDITRTRAENPHAEFLVHPECGCQSAVLEGVSSGDIDADGMHLLSTGSMITHVKNNPEGEYIVATENNMINGLERAAPNAKFIPANRKAFCGYMAMITLPKLRDALLTNDDKYVVTIDPEIAKQAIIPIERMVSIG